MSQTSNWWTKCSKVFVIDYDLGLLDRMIQDGIRVQTNENLDELSLLL